MNRIKRKHESGFIPPWKWDNVLEDIFKEDICQSTNTPAVDVREEENCYIMEADLPGWDEKDVEVTIKENLLYIATKQKKPTEKKTNYLIRERKHKPVKRNFSLPKDGDPNSIKASFKNGVLTIILEKKQEAKPQNIEID